MENFKKIISEVKNANGLTNANQSKTNFPIEQKNNNKLINYYTSGKDDITLKALFILERSMKIRAQLEAENKGNKTTKKIEKNGIYRKADHRINISSLE